MLIPDLVFSGEFVIHPRRFVDARFPRLQEIWGTLKSDKAPQILRTLLPVGYINPTTHTHNAMTFPLPKTKHFKEPKPGGLVRMLFLSFQELISKFHLCLRGRNQKVPWISLSFVWCQKSCRLAIRKDSNQAYKELLRLIETVEMLKFALNPSYPFLVKTLPTCTKKNISSIKQLGLFINYPDHSDSSPFPTG